MQDFSKMRAVPIPRVDRLVTKLVRVHRTIHNCAFQRKPRRKAAQRWLAIQTRGAHLNARGWDVAGHNAWAARGAAKPTPVDIHPCSRDILCCRTAAMATWVPQVRQCPAGFRTSTSCFQYFCRRRRHKPSAEVFFCGLSAKPTRLERSPIKKATLPYDPRGMFFLRLRSGRGSVGFFRTTRGISPSQRAKDLSKMRAVTVSRTPWRESAQGVRSRETH